MAFIDVRVDFFSNCVFVIAFKLSGLKFKYAEISCVDGSMCQSLADISKVVVDKSDRPALANADICQMMEKTDNMFFRAGRCNLKFGTKNHLVRALESYA